jgi:GTP-binding protein
MIITNPAYLGSYTSHTKGPAPKVPEYAFIGRSNVGKSSLINMLCQRKGLALVSSSPGKTRSMNYFDIDKKWFLVDLPGYGYAKLPKTLRHQWQGMTEDYMRQRENLQCVFLLIDSCVPPQEIDIQFANLLGEWGVPFVLVFTKVDRKKAITNLREGFMAQFEAAFLEHWEAMPQYFLTSAESGQGREELGEFIRHLNENFNKELSIIKDNAK